MKISVVTPFLNEFEMIELACASIADQLDIDVEHIIQTPLSSPELSDFRKRHSKAEIFVEQDTGMYDAINRGWARSKGEILCHLNSDEQYLPGTLKIVSDHFSAHPKCDVLFADVIIVDTDGHPLTYRRVVRPTELHTRFRPLSIFTAGTFFRRALLDRGLLYPSNYRIIGDAVWVNRLCRAGVKMSILARPVATFTLTGSNLGSHPSRVNEERRHQTETGELGPLTRARVLWTYRLRRILAGATIRRSVNYSIYTKESSNSRQHFVTNSLDWKYPPGISLMKIPILSRKIF